MAEPAKAAEGAAAEGAAKQVLDDVTGEMVSKK